MHVGMDKYLGGILAFSQEGGDTVFAFAGSLALWKDRVFNAALKDPGGWIWEGQEPFPLISQ